MRQLIYNNERCMLRESSKLFLTENCIETHMLTVHHRTGNADVERLHDTLNEHFQITTTDTMVTDENSEDKIHRIFRI